MGNGEEKLTFWGLFLEEVGRGDFSRVFISVQWDVVAFLKIQVLRDTDIPQAVALDRLCLGGLWSEDGYQRELESPNSDLLGLWWREGLEDEPRLIGLACLWAILEEAHITILAVHPDCRRRGLGKLLLYTLLKLARCRGLERATLEVRASNQGAISLYRQFGFRDVGVRCRYYQAPEEDGLILWMNGIDEPEFEETLESWQQKISQNISDHFIDIVILNEATAEC